jgi:chlorobactene glucosyltransferase
VLGLCIFMTVVVGLAAAVWASRHYLLWREHRAGSGLSPESPGPPADPPRVSVIIPAKDEGHNIEACLRSWQRQDYPNFEIIVSNDRSRDQTGAIAERLAAEDPRLRVVHIEDLPEGWCGKGHAIWKVVGQTDGEWICMTDADCRQTSDRTLSVAMQYAVDQSVDLLTMLPKLEMRSFWENVVQPVCGGIMMIWFHPDRVNNPQRRNAYANGAFVLMPRTAYEAVGTHAAIPNVLMEDMQLARRTTDASLRLRVVRSRGLYRVRMYTCLREILRGWTRIFLGSFGSLRRLTISLVVLLVMGLLPYAAAATGFAMAGAGAAPSACWWACGILGAATVVLQGSVVFRFYRLIDARAALVWTYPLGCVMAVIAVVTAITKLRPSSKVIWKGTTYAGKGDS